MKGNEQVIDGLNRALTIELTAINQYFCQAKMCENWGLQRLGRLSDIQTLVVNVTNAVPLAAAGVTASTATPTRNTKVTFTLQGTDVVGDQGGLRYSFATSAAGLAASYAAAGTANGVGSTGTKVFAFSATGAFTIWGRVFDDDGGFKTYSRVVNVS